MASRAQLAPGDFVAYAGRFASLRRMRSVLLAILCLGVVSASAGRESRALAAPSDAAPVKPWLGVGIEQGYRGVRIVEVVPDTPADIVGLVLGD